MYWQLKPSVKQHPILQFATFGILTSVQRLKQAKVDVVVDDTVDLVMSSIVVTVVSKVVDSDSVVFDVVDSDVVVFDVVDSDVVVVPYIVVVVAVLNVISCSSFGSVFSVLIFSTVF